MFHVLVLVWHPAIESDEPEFSVVLCSDPLLNMVLSIMTTKDKQGPRLLFKLHLLTNTVQNDTLVVLPDNDNDNDNGC